MNTPLFSRPVNAEQFEAEFDAGHRVACHLTVSQSTLFLLVHGAWWGAAQPSTPGPVRRTLEEFAADAERKCAFPPEMTKLLNGQSVQTSGQNDGGEA